MHSYSYKLNVACDGKDCYATARFSSMTEAIVRVKARKDGWEIGDDDFCPGCAECPSEECGMCTGEFCDEHGAEPCDCDVIDRHG